ncbi:MAG: hypothetical protein ACAH83_18105 [Alphaproteobacteria bacterium]
MISFTPKIRIAAALILGGLLLCGMWLFPVFFEINFILIISLVIAGMAAVSVKGTERFAVSFALFFICVLFITLAPNPLGKIKRSIACDWFDRCEPWQLRRW